MAAPNPGSPLDRWYRRTPDEIAAEKVRKAEADHLVFFAPRARDREPEAPVRAVSAPMAAQAPPNRASLPRTPTKPYVLQPRGAAPPRTPKSDESDPVARWAEMHVGVDEPVGPKGYRLWNTSPESRGRLDNNLPEGLRGLGDPKCNKFVWDAQNAGGHPPGRLDQGRIPVAKDWGEPNANIGNFAVVKGPPQPGDVISNGRHVGIYAPRPDGRPGTVSAATPGHGSLFGGVVHNDWGFRGDEGPITIKRYVSPQGRGR